MTLKEQKHSEMITVEVAGSTEEWKRLQETVFGVIDTIAKRVGDLSGASLPGNEGSNPTELLQDITKIATDWARAKVEKPTLENAKLRAEIASEYAEAKRRWAEASKAEAEAERIQAEGIAVQLDNLERLLKFSEILGRVRFSRIGNDAHLVIDSATSCESDT